MMEQKELFQGIGEHRHVVSQRKLELPQYPTRILVLLRMYMNTCDYLYLGKANNYA